MRDSNMIKKIKILTLVFLISIFLFPAFVIATNNTPGSNPSTVSGLLKDAGSAAQYAPVTDSTAALTQLIGSFIQIFLSLLGVIFIVLAFYAGYLWMTASGNGEQVDKAQGILKNAIIGLIIVVSAYAITYFVLYYFAAKYTNPSSSTQQTQSPAP